MLPDGYAAHGNVRSCVLERNVAPVSTSAPDSANYCLRLHLVELQRPVGDMDTNLQVKKCGVACSGVVVVVALRRSQCVV